MNTLTQQQVPRMGVHLNLSLAQCDKVLAILTFYVMANTIHSDIIITGTDIPEKVLPLIQALEELSDTDERLYLMYVSSKVLDFFDQEDAYYSTWLDMYKRSKGSVELFVKFFNYL